MQHKLAVSLELPLVGSDYGLSARRLWEHSELGQINTFDKSISTRQELNDTSSFIDVVRFKGPVFFLQGLTLADLTVGRMPPNCGIDRAVLLSAIEQTSTVEEFVRSVSKHLCECSIRKAVRNQHHQFLPTAGANDSFGVPHIFSALKRRLLSMGSARSSGEQWLRTIENLQKKGVRLEEIESSQLLPKLCLWEEGEEQFSAAALEKLCDFADLRLSVIPVVSDAERQLRFVAALDRTFRRVQKIPAAQVGQARDTVDVDPVFGYRIENVKHFTLWGEECHWQAVTHGGEVIGDDAEQTLFRSRDAAADVASMHARRLFPKRTALGNFGSYAWTGGESYREWLITLPYFPATYLSGHFEIRNVLAHIRCDVRSGADTERILMLQEVQSDWAQRARRAISTGTADEEDEVPPPFMKEWITLAMKLVLLHAAHEGLDAVAWTNGAHQAARYNGLGAPGLIELYDRTLPREVNRILKSFGLVCGTVGAFVPTNFKVTQSENGYEVYSLDDELLGVATTFDEAREFFPDQGHEFLVDVHGVRLTESARKEILERGFPAWGCH
jgi:hypothetical protein